MCLYSSIAPSPDTCPHPRLCPLRGVLLDGLALSWRQLLAASLAWYAQPVGGYVNNMPFRIALHDRLCLPLHSGTRACRCVPRSTGLQCAKMLDAAGAHANACCHSMLTSRHHLVRDTIRQLASEAGWAVSCEQLVTLACVPPSQPRPADVSPLAHADEQRPLEEQDAINGVSPQQPLPMKRADLVCTSPAGSSHVLDIVVTHCKHCDVAADVLQAAEERKLSAYHARATGRMSNGDRMIPFAVTTQACISRAATSFMWQLAADTVAKRAWKSHAESMADATVIGCFFRMAAMLGRAVCEGQARVLLAAGPMRWQ